MLKLNQIKICGLTRSEDVKSVVSFGFCALGFILYDKSARYIHPNQVQKITEGVSPFVNRIGVVVNETVDNLIQYYHNQWFDKFQLHGDETPEYCHLLKEKCIPYYKAFRIDPAFDFSLFEQYPCDTILLDTAQADHYGGTGKTWDWSLLQSTERRRKIIIAGGLTAENIMAAHSKSGADAYDMSSGLEISPGIKSPEKIKQLNHVILTKPNL